MVDNIERMFVDIVYKVVAENSHNGDYQCAEMLVLQWGWDDARDLKRDDLNNTTATRPHITSAQGMVMIHTEVATTLHPSLVQYETDETNVEYTPLGPHIPLEEFSMPCEDLFAPDDHCGICNERLIGPVNCELVRAICQARHPFHEDCLNEWVNHSAMPNANTCPLDREVLCEG
ncbi:hypothetical protein HBH69_090010 [Parastagonospora nodorum]|nr:hypothetical protein HBH51_090300 [Parastagonospora nodorum]KAH4989330.1 hypothetical protein HBI76_074010 [Parastagonospora nodorum]KAH5156527.1 hypothetical protein HBH69_090010 [Parastagonospora nodorum]KAH6218419.1 hypothetical protein HBI43_114740 [Parastagonospora nodorum]KAH6256479.1 hypothetical protein HBI42_114270 [Parastagonospora nodorum]